MVVIASRNGLGALGGAVITRLHDLARFRGADGVCDVRVDTGPIKNVPRGALCGLRPTVTVMEEGQDIAMKDRRDHHPSAVQEEVPVCVKVFPYLPVRPEGTGVIAVLREAVSHLL